MTIYDADIDAAVWQVFKALPRWFQVTLVTMLTAWTLFVLCLFVWALTR